MTKQISNLVVCVFCIGFLVACSGTPGMAADKAKYSGKYSLQGRKTASGNKIDSTIEVIQSDDHIQIIIVPSDTMKKRVRFPSGGSRREYRNPRCGP